MIGFRASPLAVALLSAVVAGGGPLGAAAEPDAVRTVAEPQPPVRLAPPRKRLSPRAPLDSKEGPESPEGERTGTPGPETGMAVEVDQLQAIDPDSVGVLDESQGGFGIDMWEGTPRSLVEQLLPSLPVTTQSRAMRDLMRRLLMSVATAPAGPAAEPSLIAIRVERLAAMGEIGAVLELLNVAPTQLADETLWRVRVDSLFLTNDHTGACAQVRNLIRQYQGTYWQKAFIFCQALSGENEKAQLGTALLREQTSNRDAAFFTLVSALTGEGGTEVKSLIDPTPLHIAMMRTAKRRIPEDSAAAAQPVILRAIAVSPNAALDTRLEAAERAEAAGVLSAEALSQIYASVPFTPEELSNALTIAEDDGGPRGRAILYQAARMQTVPTAKAEALQTAWRLARKSGGYATAVRVNMPLLLEIEPTTELLWFGADAGRALFFAGLKERAMSWYALLAREAGYRPEANRGRLALWPLAQLADDEDALPWDSAVIAQWRQAQEQQGGAWQQRVIVLLSLFDAMGRPVNSGDWVPLPDNYFRNYVAMPVPAIWYSLRAATEERRLGETVMLSLLSLGEGGPAEANPILLNSVISSLRFVGLDAESHALAIEAAVAAGI